MSLRDMLKIDVFGQELDLSDVDEVIDLFEDAAHANLNSRIRKGSVDYLLSLGRLVMTGRLMDNRKNLERAVKLADLDADENNHLVLHGLIHGPNVVKGLDLSYIMFARAAAMKMKYEEQIHILLSKHELAQVNNQTLPRKGVDLTQQFWQTLDRIYGEDDAEDVRIAICKYIRSLSLAVRTESGLLCCHSLPDTEHAGSFDHTLLHRTLHQHDDLSVDGHAYHMVNGKNHEGEIVMRLRGLWDVKMFLIGNRGIAEGYSIESDSLITLSSEHEKGAALRFDLWKSQTTETLEPAIVPLASIEI
jgi:hypothetical protein